MEAILAQQQVGNTDEVQDDGNDGVSFNLHVPLPLTQ
jgi:hypothetical protein